jgi:nucleotide-binding universal stress UspA family protein
MPLVERILVPVDFSERSLGAARYVEAIAGPQGGEVTLVHVTTPLNYELSALDVGGTVLTELNSDRSAELREQLDNFLKDSFARSRVARVLLDGDPARRIVEYAHENRISLIVMPTHGYGLFRRFLLGSVTAKVLHDADCPVWTGVHIDEAPAVDGIRFRKVMVAVDLCPTQSLKALAWGAQFAEQYGAAMVIAHAYPSLEGRGGEELAGWRENATRAASDEINKMQRKLGIDAPAVLESGDPAAVITNLAAREQVDVLVIGRGSAAGVFGRLRANAYAIIRQSPCPVVSV